MNVQLIIATLMVIGILVLFTSVTTPPPAPPQIIYVVTPEREQPSGCASLFVIGLIVAVVLLLVEG
ncbi:MAG: hypothetical protein H7Y32_09535 [Chloroflexales bacterium]|nr:hypothetical protein [Chloroflexales bacterium]